MSQEDGAPRFPAATAGIVAACLAVTAAGWVLGVRTVVWALGLWPLAFRAPELLMEAAGPAVPVAATLLTWTLPQAGAVNTVANLAGLVLAGGLLERRRGPLAVVLSFVGASVVAGLTLVALLPEWGLPFAGASPAVLGMLGVLLAVELSRWIRGGGRGWLLVLALNLAMAAAVVWLLSLPPASGDPTAAHGLAAHLVPFATGWLAVRLAAARRARKSDP